jgi:hypothetical protein
VEREGPRHVYDEAAGTSISMRSFSERDEEGDGGANVWRDGAGDGETGTDLFDAVAPEVDSDVFLLTDHFTAVYGEGPVVIDRRNAIRAGWDFSLLKRDDE